MPGSDGIPDPIRRFIAVNISSIEQIEVLILLRASAPREWTPAEVSRELGSSVMSIQDRLGDLTARGFLLVREAEHQLLYRYAPENEELQRLIDGLASAYKERRLTVVNLIYAKPQSDVKSFSDAFKISRSRGDE